MNSAERLSILTAIFFAKPDASPRTLLIAIRRLCRVYLDELEVIADERQALRRKAAYLGQFKPFTAGQVIDFEFFAKHHRTYHELSLHEELAEIGRHVLTDSMKAFSTLGFDGVCDVLNVSREQRERYRGGEHVDSLAGLVFVWELENSSETKGAGWAQRGPLYAACSAAMQVANRQRPDVLYAVEAPRGPRLSRVK